MEHKICTDCGGAMRNAQWLGLWCDPCNNTEDMKKHRGYPPKDVTTHETPIDDDVALELIFKLRGEGNFEELFGIN